MFALIHLSMLLTTFLAAKKVVLVHQIRLSPPTFVPNEDKKMASRFDLLNAYAPIVTNSPWFGTVMEYSTEA
ncbi:hypothetical protein SILAB01_01630 [Lacticaseibacillus paracasei]|uniref:hypothetical protein n=1 Tax=Lacticaseibacillus paracasei TaxID=1597 RepID=UPI00091D3996|nr:hypothetical protein [Lacticaseibacillus paracasei]GAV17743.1 hypothetical protein SILAB01_01630 [Lacticaseibacillus paracasei]